MLILAVLHLIVVHTLEGREVTINSQQVTSLHAGHAAIDNKLLPPDVHCVIGLTDGKFVSVIEECETISKLLLEEEGRHD